MNENMLDKEMEEGEFGDEKPIITSEMLEEEKVLEVKNMKEIERKQRKLETEEHTKEMQELRYRRLLNLLKKSKFYSEFIHKKLIEKSQDKEKENSAILKEKNQPKVKARNETKLSYEDCQALKEFCNNIDSKPEKIDKLKSQNNKCEKKNWKLTPLGLKVPPDQPYLLEGVCMRDYQVDGLKWLKLLFEGAVNGILADEMGLGKTLQSIALICHLYEVGIPGPFLIVAPLSTLPNWLHEFNSFAPHVRVVLYHGDKKKRAILKNDIKHYNLLGKRNILPVVITSYQVTINDNFLSIFNWKYLIVDEGHCLKNCDTKLYLNLNSMKSMNRLLLTGTPLQNNLKELWSLLHFLLPEIFDSLDVFQSWFDVKELEKKEATKIELQEEKETNILNIIHQILTPFLLRRTKQDVNLNLPGKKEVYIHCPMTEMQKLLYVSVLEENFKSISKEESKDSLLLPKKKRRAAVKSADFYNETKNEALLSRPKSEELNRNSVEEELKEGEMKFEWEGVAYKVTLRNTNQYTLMKKIVNHALLAVKEVGISDEAAAKRGNSSSICESYLFGSGKMILLDQLLIKLKQRGHKVLLFSTWTSILDIIEDVIAEKGYQYERLDGSTSIENRRKSIADFNNNPDLFLFLLTNRAGGLGINLASADTVIIFDSDWNPQADLQAQDRCHRIGQTRPVVIYRMITVGTLDEEIVFKANAKRKLEKMIIHQDHFKGSKSILSKKKMSVNELNELWNKQQHSLEIKADQVNGGLSDEEWEVLLDRSDIKNL